MAKRQVKYPAAALEKIYAGKPTVTVDTRQGPTTTNRTGQLTAEVAAQARKDGLISDTPQRRPGAKEPMKGRLPDDSKFEAIYHAESKTWFGKLTIGLGPLNFQASAGSITKLCYALDDLYREFLAAQPKPAP